MEKREERPQKPFVSSLLNLPAFQEQEGENQDAGADTAEDLLSIQRALIEYFLNLPAFREIEEDSESEE